MVIQGLDLAERDSRFVPGQFIGHAFQTQQTFDRQLLRLAYPDVTNIEAVAQHWVSKNGQTLHTPRNLSLTSGAGMEGLK